LSSRTVADMLISGKYNLGWQQFIYVPVDARFHLSAHCCFAFSFNAD
jgi:hypothetical protein